MFSNQGIDRLSGIFMLVMLVAVLHSPTSSFAGEFMSEADYSAKFIGNTSKGYYDDVAYYEFMTADGKVSGLSGGDRYEGSWCFGGKDSKNGICDPAGMATYATVCFDYQGSDDDGCWQVIETGGRFDFYLGNSVDFSETILPGNPKNL